MASSPEPGKSPVRAVADREKSAESGENSPLVPSEGVGTGGAGHISTGSAITFRLPPPIPGKPGGGYPQEYHDAANLIKRNFKVFAERKKERMAAMQDVTLDGDGTTKPRKRDMILGAAAGVIKNVNERVSKVTTNLVQASQNYTQKIRSAVAPATPGELPSDRREKYAGWIMERISTTKKSVGFFLARMKDGSEKPFVVACKQEKIEVMEIAARRELKTTFLVEPGNVLNWTFAVKSADIKFHVMIRRMKAMGGADDEELVPAMRVDAYSMGEGTYTVTEAGQAVLVWDNSYSWMTGKVVAYRAWIEKCGTPKEGGEAAAATEMSEVATKSAVSEGEQSTGEEVAAAKAEEEATQNAEADAVAKTDAEAQAKAEEEAKAKADAEAKAKAEEEAKAKAEAEAKAKAEEEAKAKAAAEAKAKAEAEAKAKAEEEAKAEAEAEAKAQEEAKAKAEEEAKAKAEAEAKAKAEEEAKAKAEAEAKAKAEEEAKAKAEAEAKAKAEEEAKAKAETEAKAKAEEEAKAKAEAEAKAKAEEEARVKAEEEAKAKAEAEAKAKAEAEAKAKAEEEAKAKAEAEAKAKAEEEARIKAEEEAKAKAEEEAKAKAEAEAKAKAEAEAKAKEEAEAKAKEEAEAKAKEEAEAKAKAEAEAKAKAEEEAQKKAEEEAVAAELEAELEEAVADEFFNEDEEDKKE